MRRFSTLFLSALLLLGFAGSASALSISPDPIPYAFGTKDKGIIDILSVGTNSIDFKVSVSTKDVKKIGVLVTDAAQAVIRTATGSSSPIGGTLKDVKFKDGGIEFKLDKVKAPNMTDPMNVQFAGGLSVGDLVFFSIDGKVPKISKGKPGKKVVSGTIVPEPSTAMLVLLGLGISGLAVAGRARR